MKRLPYGCWPSPIPASLLVAGAASPTDVRAEGATTWWSQARPSEGGRIQLVRHDPDGTTHDLLPDGASARSRVHEYGGAAWWVHDGTVFWVSWEDQRVYRSDPGASPVPLTPEPDHHHGYRYADGCVTPDGAWVICVRESHPTPDEDGAEDVTAVRNEIVRFPAVAGQGEPTILVSGPDFVAAPRISADGARLAWVSWEHPDMPWDTTTLWAADLVDGTVTGARAVGRADESLVQPEWAPDGSLLVVSDRDGWWNVHRVVGTDLVPLHPLASEVGLPAWVFGQSRYVVGEDVWFTCTVDGTARLVRVPVEGTADEVVLTGSDGEPLRGLSSLRLATSGTDDAAHGAPRPRLVAIAAQAKKEPEVVEIDLAAVVEATQDGRRPGRTHQVTVLCPARDLGLDPAGVSVARPVDFPSENGRTAHGQLYLPASAVVGPVDEERPPLIVTVHGGPHAAAQTGFRLAVQFWTSRGFAVLDVDYAGSTGYGRPYRRLLDDAWGIADVADVCAGATWAAAEGLVDGSRTAIRGGSAGGFTTLMALATTDVFAAGVSLYGVADLTALAADTHKFESRYLDRLIGPYPEAADVYRDRSPLSHVDGLSRPLLVLQGAEDAVVPPAQSEAIVAALAERGVPHAYLLFPGEQHGFRTAQTIVRALEAELSFYGQVFGFVPDGQTEALPLEHADRL